MRDFIVGALKWAGLFLVVGSLAFEAYYWVPREVLIHVPEDEAFIFGKCTHSRTRMSNPSRINMMLCDEIVQISGSGIDLTGLEQKKGDYFVILSDRAGRLAHATMRCYLFTKFLTEVYVCSLHIHDTNLLTEPKASDKKDLI